MTDDTVAYMGWDISAQEQIDGFRREVRELKAENALLWEQGALLFDKTLELGTENAKLREFIGLKETCWKYVGWCDECPYNGVDDEHDDCNCTVQERISSLARELGVEVD